MSLEVKQQRFIEQLFEDQDNKYELWFSNLKAQQQQRVVKKTNTIRHGMTHIAPLTCLGPRRCPFFKACPIPESHSNPGPDADYPINMGCVLESSFVAQRVVDYMKGLDVDPENPIEMSLVNELAIMDMMKNRAVLVLSVGDSLEQGRDLLAVDEMLDLEGNKRSTTRLHPAVEILDKLEKRRTKIYDKFLATRESKVKVLGNIENQTQLQADIKKLQDYLFSRAELPLTKELTLDEKIE